MPAPARTPRENWIDAGLRALATNGPNGVRVEVLADELGVTKGGFYGQFADRRALLEELLDAWEHRSIDDVLAQVEAGADDAPERIRRAGALTFRDDLLAIDLAIRFWARSDQAVARRLRRVDNRRMKYLREQFSTYIADPDEIEARATLAFGFAIGQHFMAVDHRPHSRREAVSLAASLLVDRH
ncbi:MAG TPA: TetR/AcrR family transcriptional regulator [Acidimicrobiales bacterium]|jgi:AcrR family transcriptional regulator|nr:TetR/AcrR family transcriptional regulator [Acidimicrobiales bacterium]